MSRPATAEHHPHHDEHGHDNHDNGHGHDEEREVLAVSEEEHKTVSHEVYGTLGDVLGWKNVSMDTAKVQDVELLACTGYDGNFVAEHHRIAALIDASQEFGASREKAGSPMSFAQIYEAVSKNKMQVRIKLDGMDYITTLPKIAQYRKIRETNKFLGKFAIQDAELKKRFFNGDPLVVTAGGNKIDLREQCPMDDMSDFDMDTYFEKIRKNQVSLQMIGQWRDETLKLHHIENAGHALFYATGKIKGNGLPEFLWLPSSAITAANDARGDLTGKTTPAFRAEGHVHEIGTFNEDYGMIVKFDPDLLQKHRSAISSNNVFERTLRRTFNNAVALQTNERFESEYDEKLGKTAVYIGGKNRGQAINKAMRATYDRGMKEMRGFAASDDEIDDMIFTDVIAPFLANNTLDWQMCLAKALETSNISGFKSLEASQGKRWTDANFVLKIRCRDLSKPGFQVTEQTFESVEKLVGYLNDRITIGDIPWRTEKVAVKKAEKEEKAKLKKPVDDSPEGEEQVDRVWHLEQREMESYSKLFRTLLGGNAIPILQEFVNDGTNATIKVGDTDRVTFSDYMKKNLRTVNPTILAEVAGETGDMGIEKILEHLDSMEPSARTELLDFVRTSVTITGTSVGTPPAV